MQPLSDGCHGNLCRTTTPDPPRHSGHMTHYSGTFTGSDVTDHQGDRDNSWWTATLCACELCCLACATVYKLYNQHGEYKLSMTHDFLFESLVIPSAVLLFTSPDACIWICEMALNESTEAKTGFLKMSCNEHICVSNHTYAQHIVTQRYRRAGAGFVRSSTS